ncbi:MAG: SAF domain-containing protein, partial [Balneolaceae bacterium]|nr:SAF domain-containing protein [Balneolaceae bacterium]
SFSMEPAEMKSLVEESERAFLAMGEVQYGIQEAEEKSLRYKRSIYVVEDIEKGETFTKENIRVIRPGDGMKPKFLEKVLGKKAKQDLKRGTPLSWEIL